MLTTPDILEGKLLIVDDLPSNVLLLERILAGAGYMSISSTTDPGAVCELHRKNRYDLILLDLQMPGMNGMEVMAGLQEIETDGYLPVLVVTAQPHQKVPALKAGARDFITKPFEFVEVLARVHNMLELRMLHRQLLGDNEALERRVRERTADLEASYLETIFTMLRAAEYRDEDSAFHLQRIGCYARALAAMLRMDAAFVEQIYFASPMHDIGKIGIPDYILAQAGGFTPNQTEIMHEHAAMGARILGKSKSPHLKMAAEIALHHHERWDGSGYPSGKEGEAIPVSARIMYLCDVYDGLRSGRPFKPAYDHATAVRMMTHGDERTRPEHFDPAVLSAFSHGHQTFCDIFAEHPH